MISNALLIFQKKKKLKNPKSRAPSYKISILTIKITLRSFRNA
jgi:hypothetical protein